MKRKSPNASTSTTPTTKKRRSFGTVLSSQELSQEVGDCQSPSHVDDDDREEANDNSTIIGESTTHYMRQPRHYYLKNFVHILDTVMEKDSHLFRIEKLQEQKQEQVELTGDQSKLKEEILNDENGSGSSSGSGQVAENISDDFEEDEKVQLEAMYLNGFKNQLSHRAQRLFVRLYNRKWQWFQVSKLASKYAEDLLKPEEEEEEEGLHINDENEVKENLKQEDDEEVKVKSESSQDIVTMHSQNNDEEMNSQVSQSFTSTPCSSFQTIIQELITHRYIEQFSIDERSCTKTAEEYEKNLRQILSSCTIPELESVAKKIQRFMPSKKLLQPNQKKKDSPKIGISPKKCKLIDSIVVSDTKSSNIQSAKVAKQKTIHSFFKTSSQSSQDDPSSPSTPNQSMKHFKSVYSALELQFKTKFLRVTPLAREVFRRIHHLFFLNQTCQDASIMVIESRNIRRFPQYDYKPMSVFKSRKDLARYEEALRLLSYRSADDDNDGGDEMEIYSKFQQDDDFDQNDQLEITMETLEKAVAGLCTETARYKQQKSEESTPEAGEHYLLRFTAGWIYAKLVSMGVTLLEQQKLYEKATFLLRDLLDSPFVSGRRGKWWNRLALDLQHMNQHKDALDICLSALKEDKTLRTAQRYTLEKRAERLNRKCKTWTTLSKELQFLDLKAAREIYIQSQLVCPGQSSRKSRFLSYDKSSHCSVEELAMQYYLRKNRFSKGMHCEGSVWSTLFGLLFWDIIYDSSIPNVFQSKYQSAPLDLGTDAFYASRQEKIEKRLSDIKQDNGDDGSLMETMLRKVWQEQHGVYGCIGRWDSFELEDLVDICKCFKGNVVSAVCRMLAEDYRHNRSGLPDLILWSTETEKALFSEVKGPRDRLSDKQHAWIDVLIACGAEVEICHVAEKSLTPKKGVTFDDIDLWSSDQVTSAESQSSNNVQDPICLD